jgi:hypothetical protein
MVEVEVRGAWRVYSLPADPGPQLAANLACLLVGVALGKLLPDFVASLSQLEFGRGSQVNIPIAVLIWLMIFPMMLKIDFGSLGSIAKRPKGLFITLFVNWLVKPFSMAFLAWVFLQHVFAGWVEPDMAVTKLVIDGQTVEWVALPLIFRHFRAKGLGQDEAAAHELFETVKIYNAVPPEAETSYRNAVMLEHAASCQKENQS